MSGSTIRWAAVLGCLGFASGAAAVALDVNGSTTVAPVVVRAAESLAADAGVEIRVDTQGGSSGGIAALGRGRVDVAMSSRPLTGADRAKYPDVDFRPVRIGTDAVALVVSPDVWHSGVRELTREQVRGIYERRIESWAALGGVDRPIVFFNKEPGRGTWEVFANWLYGKASAAPLVSHREVGSNEELLLEPEVVLMDEPTSALDPESQAVIEGLVRARRGRQSFVVVTHDLAQARRIADAAVCLSLHEGVGELAPCADPHPSLQDPACRDVVEPS